MCNRNKIKAKLIYHISIQNYHVGILIVPFIDIEISVPTAKLCAMKLGQRFIKILFWAIVDKGMSMWN